MITGATKSITKEIEEVYQAVRYSSLFIYMLKPTSLLTEGFKDNKKSQEYLFKNMCNVWAQAYWGNRRISVNSYFYIKSTKISIPSDQYNPFVLNIRLHNRGCCW